MFPFSSFHAAEKLSLSLSLSGLRSPAKRDDGVASASPYVVLCLSGLQSLLSCCPYRDAWQIYSSAAYGRISEWSFVNPTCNEKTKGFVLSEVRLSENSAPFSE